MYVKLYLNTLAGLDNYLQLISTRGVTLIKISKVFTKSQEKQFTTKIIFKYIATNADKMVYLGAVQFKNGNQFLKQGNRVC